MKMPHTPGKDEEEKAYFERYFGQMENQIDSIQPGVWRKGRCAADCDTARRAKQAFQNVSHSVQLSFPVTETTSCTICP